jgi:broad specificity phosphatase PhoE
MDYVFVRHGITDNLEGGRIQGWGDTPLSTRGRQQAQAAADRLKAQGGVTAVLSSPVHRTMETASIIGATLGLPVQQLPALAERRMPSRFWGKRRDEITDYLTEFTLHTREPDWAYEDEDSLRASADRAREVVCYLHEHAAEPGLTVLVTHGTILRFIVATLLLPEDAPLSEWADLHAALLGPQPCAFAEVSPGSERMAMRGWNDCTHLAGLLDYDGGPGA